MCETSPEINRKGYREAVYAAHCFVASRVKSGQFFAVPFFLHDPREVFQLIKKKVRFVEPLGLI